MLRIKVTVTYAGDKIARDVVEYDVSDPATAGYANFQRLSVLLRQHYEALNRGDAAAAAAVFAEDAVVVSGGGCSAERPCGDRAAILSGIQTNIRNQNRFELGDIRPSATGTVARVESRNPIDRAVGVEQVVHNVTVTLSADGISRLVAEVDVSDPRNARYLEVSPVIAVTGRRAGALARRDVAGVLATYADDAVFEGGHGLCAQRPCVGKEAIRREIERSFADNTRATNIPGTLQVSGDTQTNQVELRSDSIARAGVDRISSQRRTW